MKRASFPTGPGHKERGISGLVAVGATDHRGTAEKLLLGIQGRSLTPSETKVLQGAKQIIYKGYRHATRHGVPKSEAVLLLDEQYGDKAIRKAVKKGLKVGVAVETSGGTSFEFAYGEDFGAHIEQYRRGEKKVTFIKALVRYNPEDPNRLQQIDKLKQVSQFADEHGYKLLLEPLVPPTEKQLEQFEGDKKQKGKQYDEIVRPGLTVTMMQELQEHGIEPDVWKIEGMNNAEDYQKVAAQARSGEGREKVGVIILGRGAEKAQVDDWIKAGAGVNGIVGFAVGRTIFVEPMKEYLKVTGKGSEENPTLKYLTKKERKRIKKAAKKEAIKAISSNYQDFYRVYTSARRSNAS